MSYSTNIIITALIFLLGAFGLSSHAQTYVPISVTGFNHDLIANGAGGVNRAAATTTITFDDTNVAGSDNVMYSKDFRGNNNPTIEPPFGLPINRVINSVNLPGASYNLASYSGSNALVLKSVGSLGTLTLGTPGVFSRIAFLGSSAQGSSSFDVTLNFSDGTNTKSSFSVPDWFFGPNFAIQGIGRVTRTEVGNQESDEFSGTAADPRLYDNQIILTAPFTSKVLTSITFQKTSVGGSTAILAINGITAINAPNAPIATAATNVNNGSFTANWIGSAGATGYFIDVSTSPTFSTQISGYNNLSVGNVLSFNITGLPNAPLYYYRVRASNAAGISASSNTIEVCLLPEPSVVCNNIAIQLDFEGNYTLTQADISAIGNGSKDNCGDPVDITLSVNQSVFNCNDLVLGQPNNYAVELDGVNDFIQSQATNVLKVIPLTVEAWVKPILRDEIATFYPNNILSNDNPGLFGHGFGANINSTVNQITVEYQNDFRIINNAGLSTNTWQHIAVVYTSGNVKTYVNGTLIDDFTYVQGALTGTGSFWIGKHNDDASYGTRRFYKGQLDEVRVWHRALNGSEILANMNTTSVGNESDLKLYYTFEDGPGKSTVTDILGNSNADFKADMNPNTSWVNPGAPVIPAVLGKSVTLTVTNGAGITATCIATVTIEDNIPPVAKCPTTPPTIVIDATGNGTLTANLLAGGNSTDNCADGLVETSPEIFFSCIDAPTAMVALTATDGAGNINTAMCTVIIDDSIKPIAVINSGGLTVLDNVNTSITLDATGSVGLGTLFFEWSTGEFGPIIQVSQAGIYSVTVTNNLNDCSDVAFIEIFDAKCKAIIMGSDVLTCSLDKLTLTASDALSPGSSDVNYIWSTGSTSSRIDISTSGLYWVKIELIDKTCSDTAFIEIIENKINPTARIDVLPGNRLNCQVNEIELNASLSITQGDAFFQWSTSETGSGLFITTANIYTVTVTDEINGCKDVESIEIFDDNIILVLNRVGSPCIGETITLNSNVSGASQYNWSGPNSYSSSTQNATITNVGVVSSGLYRLVVILANGCQYIETINLTINQKPNPSISGSEMICAGDQAVLTENSGTATSWSWSGPAGAVTVNNMLTTSAGGLYIVTATDANGCASTASKNLIVNNLPFAIIETTGSLCGGDSITLSANSATAISWAWQGPGNFNGSGMEIVLSGSDILIGNYTVSVTDVNGCVGTANYSLQGSGSGAQIESNFLVSGVACSGDSIRLIDYSKLEVEDNVTFAWDFGNGTTSFERDPIIVYSNTGSYIITLKVNSPACEDVTIRKKIEILACLKVPDFKNKFAIVYPTPSNGEITLDVRLPKEGEIIVKIKNLNGQVVAQYDFEKSKYHNEQIDINHSGVYIIEVIHPYGIEFLKVFIMQ